MVSLVIFFIHGSTLDLKIVTKSTIDDVSIITLGVYYDLEGGPLAISGSSLITGWLANKEMWFDPTLSSDRLSLFKQLFDKLMSEYHFDANQIYFYAEGNLGKLGGIHLSTVALDLINYIQPGAAMLPTGTLECCKFINYWRAYYNYPQIALGEEFVVATNYYSEQELTDEKIVALDQMMESLSLRCAPPYIATFDKKLIGASTRYLLDAVRKVAASSMLLSVMETPKGDSRLLPVSEISDNNVYPFSEEDGCGAQMTLLSSAAVISSEMGRQFYNESTDSNLMDMVFSRTVSLSRQETPGAPSDVGSLNRFISEDDNTYSWKPKSDTAEGHASPRVKSVASENAGLLFHSPSPEAADFLTQTERRISTPELAAASASETKKSSNFLGFFSCCHVDTVAVTPLKLEAAFDARQEERRSRELQSKPDISSQEERMEQRHKKSGI